MGNTRTPNEGNRHEKVYIFNFDDADCNIFR